MGESGVLRYALSFFLISDERRTQRCPLCSFTPGRVLLPVRRPTPALPWAGMDRRAGDFGRRQAGCGSVVGRSDLPRPPGARPWCATVVRRETAPPCAGPLPRPRERSFRLNTLLTECAIGCRYASRLHVASPSRAIRRNRMRAWFRAENATRPKQQQTRIVLEKWIPLFVRKCHGRLGIHINIRTFIIFPDIVVLHCMRVSVGSNTSTVSTRVTTG